MRLGTRTVERGRCARRGRAAARWAAASLFVCGLGAAPALEAKGPQAGPQVSTWAPLPFPWAGRGYPRAPDRGALLVGRGAGGPLQPPRATSGAPGATAV